VIQPLLFINQLVGTLGLITTDSIEEYLKRVIVSRFNDFLGEKLDTLLNLPGQYDDMSAAMTERLRADFSHFGLGLTHLYVTSITPPPEVQSAIDERSRLKAIGNLDDFIKMKAAMAMEKAASNPGGAGEGMGMGLGFMMPAMFAQSLTARTGVGAPSAPVAAQACPECQHGNEQTAHFCAACGHQLVVFDQCAHCFKNVAPHAKFCSACGRATAEKTRPGVCGKCKAENLAGATFCNQCGEKL
jgi:membrane protease subunit (stomatin/prohibitin family)